MADRRAVPETTDVTTSLCECGPWKNRAEWAEERLRHVAAILRVPDGARYLNDVREAGEIADRNRELRAALLNWLDKPHREDDAEELVKYLPHEFGECVRDLTALARNKP